MNYVGKTLLLTAILFAIGYGVLQIIPSSNSKDSTTNNTAPRQNTDEPVHPQPKTRDYSTNTAVAETKNETTEVTNVESKKTPDAPPAPKTATGSPLDEVNNKIDDALAAATQYYSDRHFEKPKTDSLLRKLSSFYDFPGVSADRKKMLKFYITKFTALKATPKKQPGKRKVNKPGKKS